MPAHRDGDPPSLLPGNLLFKVCDLKGKKKKKRLEIAAVPQNRNFEFQPALLRNF